ncbi:MAG: hypothetical protein ACXWZP_08695 [Gaiellaceae bacterium]|jgi:hypothetical protein
MSNGMFVVVLAVGAALLAVWIHARFPVLAPERLGRTMLHAGVAFLILKVTVHVGDSTLTTLGAIFVVLLPALVYSMLCMLWMVRHFQTALGFSR